MPYWDRGWVSAMYGVVGLLVLYEAVAVFAQLLHVTLRIPAITHVLIREVPASVALPFLVWALQHFAFRYLTDPLPGWYKLAEVVATVSMLVWSVARLTILK